MQPDGQKEFTASQDLTTKLITSVAVILLIGTVVFNVWRLTIPGATATSGIVYGSLAVMIILILVGTWVYRVTGYTLRRESFIIRRPIGNKLFALSEILKVIVPPSGTMRWSLRIFGNGGIFGFTGYYANATFGSMRWFATRTSNYIIVHLKDGEKIVITPDDMGMASTIRELAGLPAV